MTPRWSWTALGVLALAACNGAEARPFAGREPFIALERDFQDFESWAKVDLAQRPAVSETHASGDAHEYVSQLPARGSKGFSVGTILVKTVKSNHREQDEAAKKVGNGTDIFAMVKRGGGYNGRGAPGWEWFELRRRDDDSLGIVWRGVNPPSGEGYGGDPMGGCNGCHQMAVGNDYVHALSLNLAKL